MANPIHTYGPTCLLADDDPDPTTVQNSPTAPKIRSQFFYTSSLPIDGSLTSLPPPLGSSISGKEKVLLQPFSARDNEALEDAWRMLRQGSINRTAIVDTTGPSAPRPISKAAGLGCERDFDGGRKRKTSLGDANSNIGLESPSHEISSLPAVAASSNPRVLSCKQTGVAGPAEGELSQRQPNRSFLSETDKSLGDPNPSVSGHRTKVQSSSESTLENEDRTVINNEDDDSLFHNPSHDASISGSPFIRAPVANLQASSGRSALDAGPPTHVSQEQQTDLRFAALRHSASKQSGLWTKVVQEREFEEHSQISVDNDSTQSVVPVGVSRLHLVELPNLKMKPIYWNPLHDVSDVLRATWFYKNRMFPVETELANRLEEGYQYMMPWTETWQDELNSCVENGADAELKIVHPLWQKDEAKFRSRPTTSPAELGTPVTAEAEGESEGKPEALSFEENRAAGGRSSQLDAVRPYSNSSVIYADFKNAQILRPSLLPSVSRGRRPLSAIRKGRQIGIPVVRGFSWKAWDKLYPSKVSPADVRHYLRRTQSQSIPMSHGSQICYACAIEEARPDPTDLVLVIHGIGQKLSEKMESFHFTHSINTFRKSVHMELHNDPVWPHVSPDHGGIMVLPVNWRSTLSLEDSNSETAAEVSGANQFSLQDITPETIPAVRSLISDVMLDIPYYLSHHKPKMVQAVVKEANRIYRIWCKNNPGFQEHGRVHLIAHSLGSVIALDILSHQPTKVPRFDFRQTAIHSDIFEFDSSNLFLCGSPAGFFLLLNKARLLPRRGRSKPGSEGEDQFRGVTGEVDTYGCLAIDNLYNIMHATDPIAYRVNAAVDSDLAKSLKMASLPTLSASFLQSFGNVFRWSSSQGMLPPAVTATPVRPHIISNLPSNVELETHDFTREEIAEKRMLLLNDNGQIDYYISGGGGPLNIQYLNMLSAHSSYWTSTDFVRFFVIEVAREQGKDRALFRAEKKKGWTTHKG